MKTNRIFPILMIIVSVLFFFATKKNYEKPNLKSITNLDIPKIKSSFSSENRENAQDRLEYEFAQLRDPSTNRVPFNIRDREIKFAKNIAEENSLMKNSPNRAKLENWSPRGPYNVGGRTRALAVDLGFNGTTNKKIIAGGISGGIFLSEDDGATWTRTTSNASLPSVTCIAQDPTNQSVWYMGTGEMTGNSASASYSAMYLGQGVFKSTDGGYNWTQLPSTANGKISALDNYFDYVWNVAVHPQTGAVYVATVGKLFKSTDGGGSWIELINAVDANGRFSSFSDIAIATNGDVYATFSKNGTTLTNDKYGIFRSTDGTNFTNISPPLLPADVYRIVVAPAPSNPNTVYILIQANSNGSVASDHKLFKYSVNSNSWTDLSTSIPNETGAEGNASFSSQGGYDLIVKVKPDDENVVWIGGTNLYRSTDGGVSFTRVGGYNAPDSYALYENSHSDFHSISFYPNNPNAMINGHDGGLSKTTNDLEQPQTWTKINQGYVTSQFYGIAIDPVAGHDNFIIGGCQDNGSWGSQTANYTDSWVSLFSGDGGFAAVGPNANDFYVSSQNGNVLRYSVANGKYSYSIVNPVAQNFQFITPYLLDPNDGNIMYIAADNAVWRNSDLSGIPQGNMNPTDVNWVQLTNSAIASTVVTALAVSKTQANRLYFGATDRQQHTYIVRVDNAQNNPVGNDITPVGITQGSYPSCIAVDPANGDRIIAIFSNYNIPSLWYSDNGGTSWTDIEGNLAGEDAPSIRWGVIAPNGNYFLATSVGVYSTNTLNGTNTVWVKEGADVIGNVVTTMIKLRSEDGFMVAATHGRGVYSTKIGATGGTPKAVSSVETLTLHSYPGQTGNAKFTLSNEGDANLTYNISVSGDLTIAPPANYLKHYTIDTNPIAKNMLTKSSISPKGKLASVKNNNSQKRNSVPKTLGNDVLILDDGNDTADNFLGFSNNIDFMWCNEFDLGTEDFSLESFYLFMRTKGEYQNDIRVDVYDSSQTSIAGGDLTLELSEEGSWYTITFSSPILFKANDIFYISVETKTGYVEYPAGVDMAGSVSGKSFYFEGSAWVNIADISGYENAAFLIRAVGTLGGGAVNQKPKAVANVNPMTAKVNEQISFDASASTDTDGQITQYLWNFGDGTTSSQKIVQHSYSEAKSYTYSLTVTDDKGATDQVGGLIAVSQTPKVIVTPASGNIAQGASQEITITLDASSINEGTYTGQLNIVTNGGNISIPIDYLVNVEKGEMLPADYSLSQNYPNPFNPSTTIQFAIPKAGMVSLKIYNIRGEEVATLVNKEMKAGIQIIKFDAENLSSGLYLYKIKAGNFTDVKKMILLK